MSYFPDFEHSWRRLAEMIDDAGTVFITTHVNPDGDAIGSEMALATFLKKTGATVRVINASPTPEMYSFLDPDGLIEHCTDIADGTSPATEHDLVIFIDLGLYHRAGCSAILFDQTPVPRVIIDHHPPELVEADIVVVNTKAASAGSLVYDFCRTIDESAIDERVAVAVLTAMVADTGFFRYSNTTATTHMIAADIYRHGVAVAAIRDKIESGFPYCRQRLLGEVLNSVRLADNGRIAYAPVTLDMFSRSGADREHTDGIIDHIRMIHGVEIVFVCIQEETESFKISFRSSGKATVHKLATELGGGGHPRAAGANMTGALDDVLARVVKAASAHLAVLHDESDNAAK
jgi:bifunctional oligoribonuclease and PAP phosphatase NrnA